MRDIDSRTYYELLGVEPDATTEQIKEAYREIARIFHPDSNFYSDIVEDESKVEDSDVFKAITSAYQVLISQEKRRAYDDSLPKNLDSWDEDDDNSRFRVTSSEEGSQLGSVERSRRPTEEIPEEWRKEREYFEAHYEEILRPGPKTDLVGATDPSSNNFVKPGGEERQYETWEEPKEFAPGTRFGVPDVDTDQDQRIPSMIIAPTRRVVKPGMGFNNDPMTILMYIGIPALLAIVLVELYLFM